MEEGEGNPLAGGGNPLAGRGRSTSSSAEPQDHHHDHSVASTGDKLISDDNLAELIKALKGIK